MPKLTNNDFYYCYSFTQFIFLTKKEIDFICSGLNEKSNKRFWQYQKTEELQNALKEYNNCNPRKVATNL